MAVPALHVVGVSHHTTEVGVRELLALPAEEMANRLRGEAAAGRSLVILSTCNRFELYWWGEENQENQLWSLATQRRAMLRPTTVYRFDGL